MDDFGKSIIPENQGIPDDLFKDIIKTNLSCRFFQEMGIYVSALGPGFAEIKCRINEKHINPRGIAHGAVYFAVLDTAMGMAIRTINYNCVTIQFASSFVSSVKEGDLVIGKAEIDHAGRSVFYAQGRLYDQNEKLINTASGSFYNMGTFLNI